MCVCVSVCWRCLGLEERAGMALITYHSSVLVVVSQGRQRSEMQCDAAEPSRGCAASGVVVAMTIELP